MRTPARNMPIKQSNFRRELNEQIVQTHRKCTGEAIICYRLVNIEAFLTSIQIKVRETMFLKLTVRKLTRDTLWLGFPFLRGIVIPRMCYCRCFTNNNECLLFYKVGSFDVGHEGYRFVHHS